jgi:diguanylate cyclase (GGDEF)-like protein/PAS domain S-box-containing protein
MPVVREHPAIAGARVRVMRGLVPALVVVVACGMVATEGARVSQRMFAAFLAIAVVVLALMRRMSSVQRDVDALVKSELKFRALVQQSSDVTLIVSADGVLSYASPAITTLTGQVPAEVLGRTLRSLVHPDDLAHLTRFLRSAAERAIAVGEWRIARGTDWIYTENTATDLRHEPAIGGVVIAARDISERRNLEARLTEQAYHDSLTRLANRSLFLNRVAHAISRVPRDRGLAVVLFLDLDDFKKVNDSLGHAAGDELLVACAGRLQTCVRPGDTISRLGGDEFAVLLEGVAELADAELIAQRIGVALRSSFTVQGREVFVGVSIGIAEIGLGDTPDDVLRNADLAMYVAKSRQNGQHAIYAPAMHAELVDRVELEADLRAAVGSEEISIEFQPIVYLPHGQLYGAEALIRWRHPRRGWVEPSHFVAVAEETGLILSVGRRVLHEACGQMARWRAAHPRAAGLQVCVNLSGRHFQDPTLLGDVSAALHDSGLDPSALTLEITESVLMHQSDVTLRKLRALKAIGVRLAIDDFGTGYSSLGYLQRFPIDILKIDRTFVDAMSNQALDPVLVRAIIALGSTLNIATIAEGIEQVGQRDALGRLGCTLGQGFYFSPSLTPADFASRLLGPDELRWPTPEGMEALTRVAES